MKSLLTGFWKSCILKVIGVGRPFVIRPIRFVPASGVRHLAVILDIYNLAVRNGKSNPHHGTGYLIHPAVSRLVAEWLG